MLPWESRRERRKGRARRRPDLAVLERLEARELMAYTPLGYSLPDLTVQGFAAPVASWGQPLSVTVDVKNTGSSTLIEPLALEPGATSTADAGPTLIAVYAAAKTGRAARNPIQIGAIAIDGVAQNDVEQFTATFVLPARPVGFPKAGPIDVFFQVNPDRNVLETDFTNNLARKSSVLISPALPQLAATDLALPATMQPGDTVAPVIRVTNFGSVDTAAQGPVTVSLVASVDQTFGPGSSVLANYVIDNIPGAGSVPTQDGGFGLGNLDPQNNVVTIAGAPITLPTSPRNYFVGVVVDPSNTIQQLGRVGRHKVRREVFSLVRKVGPPIEGLPPAGVIDPNAQANAQPFPFPQTSTQVIGFRLSTTPPTTND